MERRERKDEKERVGSRVKGNTIISLVFLSLAL